MKNKQKQLKIKEKKQVKAIEEHSKQLLKSNEIQPNEGIIPEEDAKNELNKIIEIDTTIDNIVLKTLEQ